jgi:CysZ protein
MRASRSVIGDIGLAVGQMSDPRFRRVLMLGVALTVALLVAFYAAFLWLIGDFTSGALTLPVVGEVTWLGDLLGWASFFLVVFLSMFLMIPVASAITSLFLEDVADAVEAEHYPHLPPAPRVSWIEGLRETVGFLVLLVGANMAALVVYVLLPPLTPVIFYAMNGYLLGREYFQIAALRREGRAGAKALRRRYRGQIWLAGCLMAVPLSVPLVNLLVPVLGAAAFTHTYHRLAARRG